LTTKIFLLASVTDPVGKAIESLFSDNGEFQRIQSGDLGGITFGESDVLLLGELTDEEIDFALISGVGMIKLLGCRVTTSVVSQLERATGVVAGISPVIAPRVANRAVGFAGPLRVKPGAKWGVIGLGEIGYEVAKKASANGSEVVIAEIRTPRSGIVAELGVRRLSLDLLVAGSDVVSIHVRPGPTASPLISEREINLMKTGAVLINTADPSVVDEADVLAGLESGSLGGYATDCPGAIIANADDSLVSGGKLFVTTNPLTNQVGAAQQIAKFVVANVEAFSTGQPVSGIIDPIDFPTLGDPSFWSSRMSPRQD
jgi:hypothetical protein